MMVDKIYSSMHKGPFRILILFMAFAMAFCVVWDPTLFASNTSSLSIWQGLLLIWATCSGIIFGIGFLPKNAFWRYLFHPLPAVLILACGLFYFFRISFIS
ncbi:cyd operon protein YbgE [Arsenophonus sp. ENCA]|nr:cyd operon protein YbgE [Arsenophonus sp. ENCA]